MKMRQLSEESRWGRPRHSLYFITAPLTLQCSYTHGQQAALFLYLDVPTDILLTVTTNLLIINQFESFQTTKQ